MKNISINGKKRVIDLEREIELNNGAIVILKNGDDVDNVYMVVSFRDNKNYYNGAPTAKYCTLLNLDTGAFAFEERASRKTTARTNPGSYTMSECEICLIGKRGKIPSPRGARNIRQYLSEKRTLHSAKPNEIRERINRMFPEQKKIELFARQKFPGWDCWGNEV